MEIQTQWLEAPWLLSVITIGPITVEGHKALDVELLRYLDAANGRLYIVCDVRGAAGKVEPQAGLNMMTSEPPRHKNCGMLAFVAFSTLARFYAAMRVQRRDAAGEGGVTPIHMFDNPEEAERFCCEVAAVDLKRATVCDPVKI